MGRDVLHKIKNAKPNVTVVIASGFFEAELEAEVGEAGIAAFLQKPYRPDDVIRTLDSVIRERRAIFGTHSDKQAQTTSRAP
jgi:DNA-binding NarL/FixJ family response regulator